MIWSISEDFGKLHLLLITGIFISISWRHVWDVREMLNWTISKLYKKFARKSFVSYSWMCHLRDICPILFCRLHQIYIGINCHISIFSIRIVKRMPGQIFLTNDTTCVPVNFPQITRLTFCWFCGQRQFRWKHFGKVSFCTNCICKHLLHQIYFT